MNSCFFAALEGRQKYFSSGFQTDSRTLLCSQLPPLFENRGMLKGKRKNLMISLLNKLKWNMVSNMSAKGRKLQAEMQQ